MAEQMIYAANWKMCLPFAQAVQLVKDNHTSFTQLAKHNKIILCPSAPAINALSTMLTESGLAVGAQNCSAHTTGAFTGQLAATDVASAGATYCIIGHSECRRDGHETPTLVAEKVRRVLEAGMTPILCIGETADEFAAGKTYQALDAQLKPILPLFVTAPQPLLIAYEPVWAIGTGKVPTPEILAACFSYLAQKTAPHNNQITLLYGGSVSSKNAAILKKIPFLDGFLIGGASLDFQEFKKIVEC